MASNAQNFLINLEITPPPGAWSAIAARLETEYDASATAVAEKLQDIAILPPAMAWENIAAALPGTTAPIEQHKVVRLPYRRVRMLAAAVVIGLVGLTAWYFLNYSGTPAGAAAKQQQQAVTPAIENKTTPDNNSSQSIAPAIEQLQEQLAQETPEPATRYTSQSAQRRIPIYFKYDDQPMATYAGMPEEDANRFTGSIIPSVEAPLIRDANGQIILDKRLITSPDNNYITITGPNGEQTRISAKFLDIISSLNGDAEPSDYFNYMMHDNNLWKARFHEWRSKLMNQASFVPTATNFLDILELKELLQENQ
jgi:hypothetical protein